MLFLLLPVISIILLYFYITRNNNYWKNYGVPYEKPEFFFGNLKDMILARRHPGVVYADMYKKFKKYPYSGYFKFSEPGVVVNDLELVKNVLTRDFSHFAENDFQIDYDIDPIWGSNAFVQVGDKWKRTRSAWTSSLTQARLKGLYESISETADVVVEHFKKRGKENPNEPEELRIFSAKFFTDAIVASVFGLKVNSFENPDNPYMRISQSVFVSTFWEGLVNLTFFVAPGVAKFFKWRFVSKACEEDLKRVAKPIIKSREEKGFQKTNPFDSIILHNGEKTITEMEVGGIVFGFLLDGTETSSGVGGFLFYLLGKHLDVQNKLRAEVDEAYEKNGGKVDFQTIHDLPYLDMVLNETTRLYPPLLSTQRICTKDYELPPMKPGTKPPKIAKGMTAIVPVWALHMDPEYFPEPEKFDPERFSDENRSSIPKYSYLPFGDGPRICLGARFAINQMKIMVVNMIRNFEVRLHPKMAGKEPKVDPNIFVYRSVDGLWATFRERKFD